MTATAPECPSCCAPMRLASDLAAAGLSRSWVCTDTTCPTVMPEEQGDRLATRDDLLGARVEDLMRAPVTPQGGGGGSRGRREDKPGDRAAREALRERRYLDQDAAGGRERGTTPSTLGRVVGGRLDAETCEAVDQLQADQGLSDSALVRLGVAAYLDRVRHGGTPCQQCQFPLYRADERCPLCGA